MKVRILLVVVAVVVSSLFTGVVYAAGDLIVNGNLGVGTPSPQGKADINGNMIVQGNLSTSGSTSLGGNTNVNGNLVTTGSTTLGGNTSIQGNLVTSGTTTLGGSVKVNGGVKVTGSSFYVITGSCPPGDTAVSYRTAPNVCSTSWQHDPCGGDPPCVTTEYGSCTTGSHGWGTSTAYETCSYMCGGNPYVNPSYCTCDAKQMTLCNPGQ